MLKHKKSKALVSQLWLSNSTPLLSLLLASLWGCSHQKQQAPGYPDVTVNPLPARHLPPQRRACGAITEHDGIKGHFTGGSSGIPITEITAATGGKHLFIY